MLFPALSELQSSICIYVIPILVNGRIISQCIVLSRCTLGYTRIAYFNTELIVYHTWTKCYCKYSINTGDYLAFIYQSLLLLYSSKS